MENAVSTEDSCLVKAEDLHCVFKSGQRSSLFGSKKLIHAVSGVSFEVKSGEAFGIVGESGCGKSTTAKLLLNMAPVASGSAEFKGQSLVGISHAEWKPLRQKIQYVFQDPLGALDPRMKIIQQVIEPLTIHSIGNPVERQQAAQDILHSVGLHSHQFVKFPHELSGGQRQRVVLARALILKPELLVCDEPISALDVSIQAQIINMLQDLRHKMGLTIMFISHDLSVVRHLCDRVAVMYLGKIVEQGPTDQVFGNPCHPYTKALISAIPRPDPTAKRTRISLEGEPPSPIDPPEGCRFNPRCTLATSRCRSEEPRSEEIEKNHFVSCFEATSNEEN